MRAATALASILILASCAEEVPAQEPLFARAPFSPITVGKGSGSMFLTDINRDRHLDLVTQHLLDSLITVLVGDGNGRFVAAAGSPIKLPFQPGTLALGDVNNDSIADLAIAYKTASHEYVHVLIGNGRGGFAKSLGSPFQTSAAMQFYKPILRLVDVNKDGNADIVISNGRRHTIEVLLGNGAGRFSSRPVVTVGTGPGLSAFALGDVDGDGHVDLVASHSGGLELDQPGYLVTKRGDGQGNFANASTRLSLPPGTVLETLDDMNDDGRVDAVITHGGRRMLRVVINDPTGAFVVSRTTSIELDGESYAVRVADLNGDNQRDLVAATVQSKAAPFNSTVAVFLGAAGGSLVAAPGSPFPAGRGSYNVALGDIDEDGQLDLVSSSFEGDAVTILLGKAKR